MYRTDAQNRCNGPGAAAVDMAAAGGEEEVELLAYRMRVEGWEQARRGRHVIFRMTVTRGAVQWPIVRRFRQVLNLHNQLVQGLGRSAMRRGLPRPPPRISCASLCWGPRHERFLAQRSAQLERYFEALLRHVPYVDRCEALHEFLCSVDASHLGYEGLLDLEQAMGRGHEPPPIDPKAIAALPRRDSASASSAAISESRCVICQEPLELHDDVRMLPCRHEYHLHCIAQWIPHSNSCCVCQCIAVVPQAHVRLEDK